MAEQNSSLRKPRADALRNREHILEVARAAFSEQGSKVTLDDIVKRSGLGVGTLYRHFPTRDALVEALYRSEVEKLAAAQGRLSETVPPVEALREWMLLFIDLLATKQLLREAFDTMMAYSPEVSAASTELIRTAMTALVERAEANGEVRVDFDPLDLLRAVAGVAQTGEGAIGEDGSRRFVDILIAGIRVPKTPG